VVVVFGLGRGPKRYRELSERIGGISKKMLTQTLRIPAVTGMALRWCLRLTGPGLAVAATGLVAGVRPVAVAGLVGYLAGVMVAIRPLVAAARARRIHSGAGWLLAAGVGWLAVGVLADTVIVATAADGPALLEALSRLGPVLLVGVIGQVLLGSLVQLLPVAAGGGPAAAHRPGGGRGYSRGSGVDGAGGAGRRGWHRPR
jgi:hypothetical protein